MWFIYSLFFALWGAIATFLVKRFTKTISPLPLLFILFLFYLPATFLVLIFVGGFPQTTTNFYIYMLISAVLDVVAFISLFQAISKSPISLVAPIQTFTPLFVTIFAIFALGETPTLIKFMGIVLIVIGAYLLNVSEIKQGIFVPIKTLFFNTGVRLSLLSAFIWAITPIFQKKAIFETTPQIPLFASFAGILFVTLFLAPFAAKKAVSYIKIIPKNFKWFTLYGLGGALSQFAAYSAFALTNVGYSSAIFKTSVLFIVIFGGVFLKEKHFAERLFASGIMVLGVVFLVI